MQNVCVVIGNSDDKLAQGEWSEFSTRVEEAIESHSTRIHFSGYSVGFAPWQNACWVFDVDVFSVDHLRDILDHIRKEFKQDSVAWLQGRTDFIGE